MILSREKDMGTAPAHERGADEHHLKKRTANPRSWITSVTASLGARVVSKGVLLGARLRACGSADDRRPGRQDCARRKSPHLGIKVCQSASVTRRSRPHLCSRSEWRTRWGALPNDDLPLRAGRELIQHGTGWMLMAGMARTHHSRRRSDSVSYMRYFCRADGLWSTRAIDSLGTSVAR
jgi:hypothetical protein